MSKTRTATAPTAVTAPNSRDRDQSKLAKRTIKTSIGIDKTKKNGNRISGAGRGPAFIAISFLFLLLFLLTTFFVDELTDNSGAFHDASSNAFPRKV